MKFGDNEKQHKNKAQIISPSHSFPLRPHLSEEQRTEEKKTDRCIYTESLTFSNITSLNKAFYCISRHSQYPVSGTSFKFLIASYSFYFIWEKVNKFLSQIYKTSLANRFPTFYLYYLILVSCIMRMCIRTIILSNVPKAIHQYR